MKKLLKPEFDVNEVYDEVYGYLNQSRISEKNKKRLRKFASSNIAEVQKYGQVVLEIAEIQGHKRRRRKLLACKHPHLLNFLNETGLIMAHGY